MKEKAEYSILLLQSTNHKDIEKGLSIYNQVTPAAIKTDLNEIKYFINNNDLINNKLFFYLLYYENNVIGFAEIALLEKSKVLVIDYIAIAHQYRKNSVFFPIYNLLVNNIQKYYSFDYIVTEISSDINVEQESIFFERVLTLEEYRKICSIYIHPELGKKIESNFNAYLLIKDTSDNPFEHIHRKKYLAIVEDIYFSHYKQWYDVFLHEKTEKISYEEKLKMNFSNIEKKIPKSENIKLNLLKIPKDNSENNLISSAGIIDTKTKNLKWYQISKVQMLFTFLFVIMITYFLLWLTPKLNIDNGQYIALLPIILTAVITYKKTSND